MKRNQIPFGINILAQTLIALAALQAGGPTTACAANPACVISLEKKVRFTEIYDRGEAYEVRVAAAEFLAAHGPRSNSKTPITDLAAAALLKGIVEDRLTESQAKDFPHYHELLANLVRSSSLVERLRILGSYESPAHVPKSISDLLSPKANSAKPGLFSRLGFGSKPKLEFLNAEQFGNALENYPPEDRLEVLRNASSHLPRLTHLEAFRVLMSLPKPQQIEANLLLSPRLLGRLDFFPLYLVESSAAQIDTTVIALHLRDTGGNYALKNLIDFMRKNGMTDMQIVNSISSVTIDKTALRREIERQEKFDIKDALFFLHLSLPLATSLSELTFYKERIEEKLDDHAHTDRLQKAFLDLAEATRLISESQRNELTALPAPKVFDKDIGLHEDALYRSKSAYSPFLGIKNVYAWSQSPANITSILSYLKWLHTIAPAEERLHNLHDYIRYGVKKKHQELAKDLEQATGAKWAERHFVAMGIVDDSIMAAWSLLRQLPGQTATPDEAYELRAQVLRLLARNGINEIPEEKRQGLHPGISLKALQEYLLSLVSGLQIQQ